MSGEEGLTARIVRLYQEGMTLDGIAEATGSGRMIVRRVLLDAGVRMRGPGPVPLAVSAEQAAAVVAACQAGRTQKRAAAECGLPLRAVRRVLAEHDAGLRALRWAWEGLYQISEGDGLEAWRMDGTGSVSAATPEGLRDAVREDWPKYALGVRL